MVPSYRRYANVAAGICLIGMTVMAVSPELPLPSSVSKSIGVIAVAAFWASFWLYVKAKGRSGWWALLAFLSVFGLVALLFLKDHAKEPAKSTGSVQA